MALRARMTRSRARPASIASFVMARLQRTTRPSRSITATGSRIASNVACHSCAGSLTPLGYGAADVACNSGNPLLAADDLGGRIVDGRIEVARVASAGRPGPLLLLPTLDRLTGAAVDDHRLLVVDVARLRGR